MGAARRARSGLHRNLILPARDNLLSTMQLYVVVMKGGTEILRMTSREQIFAVFRNLKWIIAVSLVLSVALYLPDQVRELYRISAADVGWTMVKQFAAVIAIAV